MKKKIFISYSHEDKAFKDMLVKQLKVLELEGNLDLWEDSRIETGIDWFPEIEKAINNAHIAVLMISAGFLTSNFIKGKEVPTIIRRRKKEGLIVLPLFVKPCPWKSVPWLSPIQGFPSDNKTLINMIKGEQLKCLAEFAEKINKIIPCELFTPLPSRKVHLIGREKDLISLENSLNKSDRVVLVNGLGGIGKTEVCKAFFLKNYKIYWYAAWVDWISSVRESMVNALGKDNSTFISVDETDTPDDRFEKIKQKLGQIREPFLLVLDNIQNPNDPDLDLFNLLPASIKVLANSRSKIDGYELRGLDFLSPADCKTLFYEFYKWKRDDERVEKVLTLCGYHTLTVELLAKTAYHAAMTIGDLYQTLNSRGFNLNRSETVSTFWHDEKEKKTFFDHLLKVFDISGVTEKELSILINMSVLPSIYIPIVWIAEWLKLKDNTEIASLIEKGWLKRDEELRIYMHPAIQEVVKYKTKPDTKKCEVLIDSIGKKLYLKPGDNPIHKKEYVIYGESVVRGMGEEKDKGLSALANNLSIIYSSMGQLNRALEFQLKALKIREAVLDSQHPDLAASYNNTSMICRTMGQLDRALEFQLKALDIREAVLDSQHPDLATSYSNVSIIYLTMGQLDRALEFQLKAIEIYEAVLDPQHPYLATSYDNISKIYLTMGQLDRALEFQLKAIEIAEAVLDSRHPDLADSYNNISLIYQTMGQLDRALEFQLKAIEIAEAVLDPRHPSLAILYNNISMIYKNMGQSDRALEFQLKAIEIAEAVFAPQHPDLATSYNNISLIYQVMGQLDRALEFQLKAIEIREGVLDPRHPSLATSYNNVSMIYKDMSRLDRALEFQLKALKIREVVLDPQHPDLAASYNNISMIYQNRGQLDRALEFQLKSIKFREAVLGPQHPDLAVSYDNLALICKDMGQFGSALESQLKAIEIREAVLPPQHPDLATSYDNISMIYRGMNQLDRALEFQQKAVEIRKAVEELRKKAEKKRDQKLLKEEDIPMMAYHLVLSRYASPELLLDLHPDSIDKAIRKIFTPGEETESVYLHLQKLIRRNKEKPNPLWNSWIKTTQSKRIKEIKALLWEMGTNE
ncbi:MAG: tetratricopeptide repeat protein [Candidatus Omnitrophota bacterium]